MSYTGSYVLNRVTAPDNYATGSTIEGVPIDRILLDVVNTAIYWQLQLGISGSHGNWESAEKYMIPGSRMIVRPNITGIRFRAATPLAQLSFGVAQAVVTVEAVT